MEQKGTSVLAQGREGTKTDGFVSPMIDLKIDYGFKKVFGTDENKRLAIGMLRAILPDKDIVDLTFIQNQADVFGSDAKKSVYDIRCTLSDGSRVIVEIQQTKQHHFKERVLYYGSMPISNQVKVGADYRMEQVIVVSFVTFDMPHGEKWDEKVRTHYRLREVHGDDEMTDRLEFVFVELGRMNKSAEECETFEEKLYHCILHMEKMEVMPKNFDEDYFKALNRAARTANFTGEELEEYRKAMRTERDLINQLAYAHDKGVEEGFTNGFDRGHENGKAEGLAEGRSEASMAIASSLKKHGTLSLEQIAQATGLSIEAIKTL